MGWQTASGAVGKIKMHKRRLSSASGVSSVRSEGVATEGVFRMDVGGLAPVSRSTSLKWSSGWKMRGNRRGEWEKGMRISLFIQGAADFVVWMQGIVSEQVVGNADVDLDSPHTSSISSVQQSLSSTSPAVMG